MSELHDAAYLASAEALKLNMLAYAGEILGLGQHGERVYADPNKPLCVRIDPGIGESFPIMDIELKPWRKRGPGSPTEVMTRAIERLARASLWRSMGTKAPPAGIMETGALTKALLEHYDVAPQEFLDATWTPVQMGDKYSDSADWRDHRQQPDLLARAPAVNYPTRYMPPELPWTAGYALHDAVFVEIIALSDEVIIIYKPQRSDRCEVRIPSGLPNSAIIALHRRSLKNLVSHPLLNRFPMVINATRHHQRSLRFEVLGSDPWRRVRFKGGNEERRLLKEGIRDLSPARRHFERLIAGILTVPGRIGDTEPDWEIPADADEIFNDYDTFLGEEIERPDFQGVAQRRSEGEWHHDDGDPPIRFDEDDPKSYE